jgi:membrane-bound ClpP family serine protease
MRWTDFMGLAGLALLVTGLLFLFPKSVERVNWMYRMGGATLWLVGFVAIVSSILARFSKPQSPKGKLPPQ